MEIERNQGTLEKMIPTNILDDLCSRFIINVPEEERKDLIRLCFQVELAHWFYIDFYCKTAKKTIGIKEFAHNIFQHIPSLQPFCYNVDRIIDEWKEYKYLVPTFGAILLDEDLSNVLLVQSYYSRSSWGFPKGKVNKDEPPWSCAIREVYEETGFNIRELIDPNEYLDARVNDQLVRLYIIPGIRKTAKFQPMTRNEIKAIHWFPLSELPATKKDIGYKVKGPSGTDSFYMVGPFIRRLRQWIYDHKAQPLRKPRRARHNSCSDLDSFGNRDYPSLKFLKNMKEIKNKAMTELMEDTNRVFHSANEHGEEVEEEIDRVYMHKSRRNSSMENRAIEFYKPDHNVRRKSQAQNCIENFISHISTQTKIRIKRKQDSFEMNEENSNDLKERNNNINKRTNENHIPIYKLFTNKNRNGLSENCDNFRPKSIELSSLLKAFEVANIENEIKKNCSCDRKDCNHIKLLNRRNNIKTSPQPENQMFNFDNHLNLQQSNNKKVENVRILSKSTSPKNLDPVGEVPVSFNEIKVSESIKRYGISYWCNFRFDVTSILKCIDEIK